MDWFYSSRGAEDGPLSEHDVVQRITNGTALFGDRIRGPRNERWATVSEVASQLGVAPIFAADQKPASDARSDIGVHGSAALCVVVGLVGMAIGMYFLLFPSESSADIGYGGIAAPLVNLHRLFVGQALTIAGAVFIAAGIRPR